MKILKFFQPNCAPCVAVDNFLKDQGVEYTSIDVTKDAKKAAECEIGFGVPVVLLFDGDNEVKRSYKYNPAELEEILSLYKAG